MGHLCFNKTDEVKQQSEGWYNLNWWLINNNKTAQCLALIS